MAKNVTKQGENEAPVTVEVIAQSIKSIADGMRELRRGPLNDRALLLLIHAAVKPVSPYKAKPTQAEVKTVLEAMESLEAQYLRKK